MTKKIQFFVLVIAAITAISSKFISSDNNVNEVEGEIAAKLSGTAFITTDLEASVAFYTNFLGYVERKRIILDTPAGLAVYGVKGDEKLEYVTLVPATFSKENPNFPGLSFVEIKDANVTPLEQDEQRAPIAGEIVTAYSVKGMEEIAKRMKAANVPVVMPVTLSATGRSKTLTVLDPNGLRVYLYEYLKK